ncbi:BRF1-domain-containing protein [Mycena indigotica]|uniref:B-related factor 1 n=1 Tax=Mycena indigotica TaxID=2126181 RepID=A0A8H6S2Z9_9AGAR|nr:BRF1-domain-containing protein [Mycena indigotica]KAF7291101.1 BRF1-domain-containing protein [Mycena indigotica]
MPSCRDCGGTVLEYDLAAGNGVCVNCGMVIEENAIVSEVTFGETSSGGAMVQGSFVAQGATHARMSGPYGNRGNGDSRAQTIENASKKINMISSVLRLSEVISNAALRMYTLAVEHKFTKGRKSMNVVAVCLYIACRQKDTHTHMLIDFSDLLQVNVFELGHTYLQLVQTLNLKLPLVDPSHFISRFAALLEFGDETPKVSLDAVRLVQRFDRDWMTRGRRPAGICGAALLLAARMNNFRRSVEEIVQVVKIADTTLKKRLEEFKNTPSGALTLADFRSVWLDEEVDPPAYTRNKEKEEAERLAKEEPKADNSDTEVISSKSKKSKIKGKRKRNEKDEEPLQESPEPTSRHPLDPAILNQGILIGTLDPSIPGAETAIEPDAHASIVDPGQHPALTAFDQTQAASLPPIEISLSETLTRDVAGYLESSQGVMLSSALDEAHDRRLAEIENSVVDELTGLDEDELNRFILTDDEVKIKERVWVELNKDYLEALAARGNDDPKPKAKKRRKTEPVAPRDTSNPTGRTAAESVKTLITKSSKYSKRINYDALKTLLEPEMPTWDDKEDGLYTFDDKDKSDSEGMLLIEEAGTVGAGSPTKAKRNSSQMADLEEEPEEASDKEEDGNVAWDDAYEQEV